MPPAASGAIVPQPEAALLAIRWMTGPAGAVLLVGATVVAWRYPLTRKRHDEVRAQLEARRPGVSA